jgi:tRNA(Ile)-lysidine synthase
MSSDLLQRFKAYLKEECFVSSDTPLLLAVSGGIDSVVLGSLCKEANYRFHIAHVNFQLRGKESERDESFVRNLAAVWKVPFHMISVDTHQYAVKNKCSIQEAARKLRYNWFEKLIAELHSINPDQAPKIICTAHHQDDNIETMVMHFFRGTGIHGLRGMLPRQGKIARPLLDVPKQSLVIYAEQNKLQWVEDSSNFESKYTRNAIRHKLLPMAATIYPEAVANLARNVHRFRDIELLYNQAIQLYKKKLSKIYGNEVHLPVALLSKSVPLHTILFEIISPYGFTSLQVEEVKQLMEGNTGRFTNSTTHRIFRNRKWLIIAPMQTIAAANILLEQFEEKVDLPGGRLLIEQLKGQVISKQNNIATVDHSLIRFPLLLRKWKPGDYFYPFGMKKKKKLSRFFIDNKLSTTEKEKIWVVEMDKKIIWVIGYRIDERFRISTKTTATLKFEFHSQRELK